MKDEMDAEILGAALFADPPKPKKPKKAKVKKPASKKAAKPKTKKVAKAKKVKTKRKADKPKVKKNARPIERTERLDMRITKAQKAKLAKKAAGLKRTVTSVVLEAIDRMPGK